jgi:hypothetical protein
MRRRRALAALLAALAVAGLPTTTVAAEPTVTVIADGLDNPRGLAIGPDKALYVAEAGVGGDLGCIDGPEGPACFGLTGAITRITPSSQRRVIHGLPSAAAPDGSAAGGASDISFQGLGSAFIPLNLGGDPAIRPSLPAAARSFGWLIRGNVRTGAWSRWADVAGHETTANPDGGALDSNPYSAAAAPSGVAVADAGGNDLLWVGTNRRIRTLAVFPDVMVPAPPFLGLPPGTEIPMQAVPNAVVRGPDGAWYVGQLTGFPFPVGAANVYRVVPGRPPQVYASGFTNIIDLAFARDGSLLVLEITTNSLLSGDLTGRLARVHGGVTRTILTDGLVAPGGLTVGPSGAVYISNFGIMPDAGQVIRVSW